MEFLDVLNEKGELTGEKMGRKEIHDQGIWHRCVHIWVLNSKGELLIQKRASQLDNFGGLWDISAAGHVSAGETKEEAAIKELSEELGLIIPFEEFIFIDEIKVSLPNTHVSGIKNHFDAIYLIKKDLDPAKLVLQEEEVEQVMFIPWRELKERVDKRDRTLTSRWKEYDLLFDYLEKTF